MGFLADSPGWPRGPSFQFRNVAFGRACSDFPFSLAEGSIVEDRMQRQLQPARPDGAIDSRPCDDQNVGAGSVQEVDGRPESRC
jgi:hypothetical protein